MKRTSSSWTIKMFHEINISTIFDHIDEREFRVDTISRESCPRFESYRLIFAKIQLLFFKQAANIESFEKGEKV